MIELLVVMGMFLFAADFALFVSVDTLRGSAYRSDRSILITALQRARAQAMNNECFVISCVDGKRHGVKILPNSTMVVFQGATYATRDTAADAVFSLGIATTTGASEFVFSQLAATSTGGAVTVVDQNGHTSIVTVGAEGSIIWTN